MDNVVLVLKTKFILLAFCIGITILGYVYKINKSIKEIRYTLTGIIAVNLASNKLLYENNNLMYDALMIRNTSYVQWCENNELPPIGLNE